MKFLHCIRRRWYIVALCAGLSLSAAATVTIRATPRYATSITMFVSAHDHNTDASSAYQASLLSQARTKSYADLLHSERMASQLADSLQNGLSAAELQRRISAEAVPDSVLLRATVTDTSPKRSKIIADRLGTEFPRLVDALERPADNQPSQVRVTVIDHAALPHSPTSPRPVRNLSLGLLIGLIMGAALAQLRDTLDTTVKSTEMLRHLTGSSPMGIIGFDSATPKYPLIVQARAVSKLGDAFRSHRAEAFRSLRTNLSFLDVDNPPRTVVVTSCAAGEGKSTTACNLAISLAEAGSRVLLIEGDLRKPRTADYLGLERAAGLTNVIVGNATLDDVLQPWGHSGHLTVLPAGPIPPNPSELLGSKRMIEVLAQCAARADIVLIDASPLLPVTDAAILGHISDGALLVVRWGSTRKEQLDRAVQQFAAADIRMLGSVLNMVPVGRGSDHYGYGYNYGYVEDTTRHKAVIPAATSRRRSAAHNPGADPVSVAVDTEASPASLTGNQASAPTT